MAPSRPCIIGLPGRSATRQNDRSSPSACQRRCTRSWSPTEAPPVVTRMSAPQSSRGADRRPRMCVERVAGDAEVDAPRRLRCAPAPRARSRWNRRSGPGRAFAPGSTSSSPVASTATFGRRCTGSCAMVHRRGQRQVAVGEPLALAQQHRRLARSRCPRRGRCGRRGVGFSNGDVSPSRAVFSWMTTVSAPSGMTPPVKMRAASPAPTRPVERMAGRDLADHLERRRRAGDVGGAHRIAVHGGDGGRRLGAQRGEIVGEHAAMRVVERHAFARQRRGVGQHARQRFGDRHSRAMRMLTPFAAR